jgi:hypothetical protein
LLQRTEKRRGKEKMRPVVLYRFPGIDEEELKVAKDIFFTTNSRMDIVKGDLVIGRYSVLPFYAEQAQDLEKVGARLINSIKQHNYIADIGQWYSDLKEITPRTWKTGDILPEEGSFVLKGETNSCKFLWDTHMFAKDRLSVGKVLSRLLDDSLIGRQTIYIREYVPLEQLTIGLHGLPITKEFRFFVYKREIICGGFYWSSHIAYLSTVPDSKEVPVDFLKEIISRIGDKAEFYAVDVAKKQNGSWVVIEINDGQMSGFSENNPKILYKELKRIIERKG